MIFINKIYPKLEYQCSADGGSAPSPSSHPPPFILPSLYILPSTPPSLHMLETNTQLCVDNEHLSIGDKHPPVGDKQHPVCGDGHSTKCVSSITQLILSVPQNRQQ